MSPHRHTALNRRIVMVVAVVAVLLSSCGLARRGTIAKPTPGGTFKYGEGIPTDSSPTPEAQSDAQGSGGSQSNGGSRGSDGTVPGPGGGSSGGGYGRGPDPVELDDNDGLGAAVCAMVRSDGYNRINVEIDAVSGRSPSQSSVTSLLATLQEVSGKQVTLGGGNAVQASSDGLWTRDEIYALADKRDVVTAKPTVSLWLGFLDGRHDASPGILGGAIGATTMMAFPDRYTERALLSKDQVERSLVIHEAGHLLALVNIGFKSPRNHEDPEHWGHSKNTASVMYWAIETRDIYHVFTGSPPYRFDADDKADLVDIASGKINPEQCPPA